MRILPWLFFQYTRHEGQGGMWEAYVVFPRVSRPLEGYVNQEHQKDVIHFTVSWSHQNKGSFVGRLTDRSTKVLYFCQARGVFLLAGAESSRKRLMTRPHREVIGDKSLVGGCSTFRGTYWACPLFIFGERKLRPESLCSSSLSCLGSTSDIIPSS